MDRMQTHYQKKIRPILKTDLKLPNLLAVPKIERIVINVGLGELKENQKQIEGIKKLLSQITGQQPALRPARKSIASFKIRAGEPVGFSLTLRGKRMYDFLERFIRIVLPRIRDFRGVERSRFDGRGNLSIGIKELTVFPEIRPEEIELTHGLQVTIVTNAKQNQAAEKLLTALGMPFVE